MEPLIRTGFLKIVTTAALLFLGLSSVECQAADSERGANLGKVRNEIARTLVPGTRYDNIVNIGCGWASGANFAGSYEWPTVLPQILASPRDVYDILTNPSNFTAYPNKYAILVKEALEARDGKPIRLIDLARTGHTSPYGAFEIDALDEIIARDFGGRLSGNTLVLYEYGPPDFIRLVSMLFDRDPALNPIAALSGGEPLPPGTALYGDAYWQARLAAELGGDPATIKRVQRRYAGHFRPTRTGAEPYVDETDVLGPPNSNDLTVSDRFFASYARDYDRLLGNSGKRYGKKVDIIAIGNENIYEGGPNFRQYANSVMANPNAAYACGFFPTFFGCRPDKVETNLGIDEGFVHPFAGSLENLAQRYTLKMTRQARKKGVTLINSFGLFAGHHSRFDDPSSPAYVPADPTYWAYMAEINALGNEVVADVMLHILNTGRPTYHRKHSDRFLDRALQSEFDGVYGY